MYSCSEQTRLSRAFCSFLSQALLTYPFFSLIIKREMMQQGFKRQMQEDQEFDASLSYKEPVLGVGENKRKGQRGVRFQLPHD